MASCHRDGSTGGNRAAMVRMSGDLHGRQETPGVSRG